MRGSRLQLAVERLEPLEHAPHAQDRIASILRAAAVCRAAVRHHVEPGEALVRDADLQVRRLRHDRGVSLPPRDEGVGPEALVFLVHHRGNDQASAVHAFARDHARGVHHCRNASLHVLRAAPVDPAVPLDRIERSRHPLDANRVEMTAEHQGRPRAPTGERADHVRAPRADVLNLHIEAEPTEVCRERGGYRAFPGRARNKRRVHRVNRDQLAQERDAGVAKHVRPCIIP